MVLAKKFSLSTERNIATYDFFDIAGATGIVNMYAGKNDVGYVLSNETFYSYPVGTTGDTPTGGSPALEEDIDFDVVLNAPLNVRGKVVCNVPISFKNGNAGSTTSGYAIVKFRKVSGGVETDLATNQGTTFSINSGSGGVWEDWIDCIEINISSVKHFKKGDTMRLTIELYAAVTAGAGTGSYVLYHDPKNRTSDAVVTHATDQPATLVFQLPLVVDR